jgi:hypothetical protein
VGGEGGGGWGVSNWLAGDRGDGGGVGVREDMGARGRLSTKRPYALVCVWVCDQVDV